MTQLKVSSIWSISTTKLEVMVKTYSIPLGNTNFKLLSDQKLTLLKVITKEGIAEKEKEDLTGILHFIDYVQDSAVEAGMSEKEVFPNL